MNENQNKFIALLRQRPGREIYEGAAQNAKDGSGFWYVTYTPHDAYRPLTTGEVNELESAGFIKLRFPGCFSGTEKIYKT